MYKLNLFEHAFCANSCMLEESVSACAQCSKIRGPSSGYRNEVPRYSCTALYCYLYRYPVHVFVV